MHVSILAQPSLSWMTMGKWFSLWPQQLLKQLGLGYPHLTGCLAHSRYTSLFLVVFYHSTLLSGRVVEEDSTAGTSPSLRAERQLPGWTQPPRSLPAQD